MIEARTTQLNNGPGRWTLRLAVALLCIFAVLVIWVSNQFLTERFTQAVRNRAEVRTGLYASILQSEMTSLWIFPQLLARDADLIWALENGDFSLSTARLLTYLDQVDSVNLTLLDLDGRVVAASDRTTLGENLRAAPYFVNGLRSNETIFETVESDTGAYRFFWARKVESDGVALGVIVAEIDIRRMVRTWSGVSEAVLVTNSEGKIIIATEPRWHGLDEASALRLQSAPSAIERAVRATTDWAALPADAYVAGEAVLRREERVNFQGWRFISFTAYSSVRERVNGVLALEIMGFAILLAALFWTASRKTASRLLIFQRESAELRALNQRLQREIAEREKAEKHLEVAEQTMAQTSKLAALGEMSAAVSHELNQPLAAMKTYLAGARLLLTRKRADEALSSFQRIDDLIERMGAITRQLKSYARKGSDAFEPVDTRAAVSTALSMMEPQLKARHVEINRTLPGEPAMIMGDRLRLEQVIINLLRNALDATKSVPDPRIDVILAVGETVTLTVRDNGDGIEDLDNLFEPFYTTKAPGDGVGLGLAISSGIVNDLGGRLTARNGAEGGAVFEVQLPPLAESMKAAE